MLRKNPELRHQSAAILSHETGRAGFSGLRIEANVDAVLVLRGHAPLTI